MQILAGDAGVEHDIVMAETPQRRDEFFEMAVEAGAAAKIVMPVVGEIEADGELIDAGLAQLRIQARPSSATN